MFGKLGYVNLVFPTANFRKSTYRPIISNENVAPKLKCAVSVTHTPDFKDSNKKYKPSLSILLKY